MSIKNCQVECQQETLQVGTDAFITLLTASPSDGFEAGQRYEYDLQFHHTTDVQDWNEEKQSLFYGEQHALSFRWQPKLTNVLHGSCRKPHHPQKDALTRADALVNDEMIGGEVRPDMLLFTGDQVYADDVAGPMLQAVQQVIDLLGLFEESLEGAAVSHSSELQHHALNYYHRDEILPKIETNTALSKLFFGAKKKPVFTSVNAKNHLISFAEIIAMYLLVWAPVLWQRVTLSSKHIEADHQAQFEQERGAIDAFVATLPQVHRVMAYVPVYMIFDDHDVTDDWNLTRGWEEEVYGHPLSKRMVGNALMGYWLCQGWGNQPSAFDTILTKAKKTLTSDGLCHQDELIDELLNFEQWHYVLETQPPVYVMDTRTRRWRSESSLNKPSGLMDWEALCEFQQAIIGKDAVIVVSAAPIYGVKFIEAIQKVFTLCGKALTVDAENWMAHKGTANVILNIFRHIKTPPEFIILSGDVHYSFVYDVRLRFRRNSPHITQFTCSGIKNTFPERLLRWLDRGNRIFYGHRSPLNIFTRRRNMRVRSRPPATESQQLLLNQAALGQLVLQQNDATVICKALCSDGETVEFPPRADE